jgi:zinc transport system substrate-binding protein
MEFTRRRLLTTTGGAAGTVALTGCLGNAGLTGGADSDELTAQATFFVFDDVTAQVAGDAANAELLVPVGQHGHGWEPGPRVREAVQNADLLVHGMTGFQPWVDDVRRDLDADDATVATVDASAGLDLLEPGRNHDDGEHEEEGTHDGEHEEEGTHDGGHEEEGTHDGGHDHGEGMDPHFWTDPLRVADAVENVRRGLADVDPDGADAYAANADAFRTRLEDLHERIASTVADASKGTILIAGHDSFQYFSERYGVRTEALTNVSPDDRPTARDIERAQAIVAEHDLEYVCADPLESQRAADQLVEATDATAVLPLTAMPGLTDEWADEDWGYVDVVENVNLPTLEQALDAR